MSRNSFITVCFLLTIVILHIPASGIKFNKLLLLLLLLLFTSTNVSKSFVDGNNIKSYYREAIGLFSNNVSTLHEFSVDHLKSTLFY